jgi:hypothetical protein
VRSVPETVASTERADEAIDLANMVGLRLDPWQETTLRAFLGTTERGTWSAFECALIVPRQNGKGAVLEAIELAALYLWPDELILHSAHEFKTSQEAFRRILRWIEGSDTLRKRVAPRGIRTSHGEEGIELRDGSRLRFVARSTGSGRGFSCDRFIGDEAFHLPGETIAALLPTLSARPNPQLLYTSSAGLPNSDHLRRVRDRALAGGDPSLAYVEWSAPTSASLDDRQAWADANPALGYRLSLDHIARERAAMGEAEFGRERLGLWDDPRGESVIPVETWLALADPKARPGDPVTFAFDVTPDRRFAAVSVVGLDATGLPVVEVVDSRPGTAWLVDRLRDLAGRWNLAGPVVCDSAGAAASIAPDLVAAGVAVRQTTTREFVAACGTFYDAVLAGTLRHRGQANLTAAVEGARRRDLGAAWAWQRRDAAVDLSPLIAGTLAVFGHLRPEAVVEKPGARISTTFYGFN